MGVVPVGIQLPLDLGICLHLGLEDVKGVPHLGLAPGVVLLEMTGFALLGADVVEIGTHTGRARDKENWQTRADTQQEPSALHRYPSVASTTVRRLHDCVELNWHRSPFFSLPQAYQ